MPIVLRVPATNDRGPQYMDQALAAIHQANPARLPFTLEFRRHSGQVTLACTGPAELQAVFQGQFFAAYPDGALEEIPDSVRGHVDQEVDGVAAASGRLPDPSLHPV